MPTKARRSASLEEANTIFCLILAASGDLVDEREEKGGESCHNCGLRSASKELPANKEEFVPLPTILVVLKVVNSPSTLIFWKIADEIVISGVAARLVDDYLGEVFTQVVDDVFVLVAELESLEFDETFVVDAYTRCLEARGQERRDLVTKNEDGDSPWLDLRTISWAMGRGRWWFWFEKRRKGGNWPELCEIGSRLSLTQSAFLPDHYRHHTAASGGRKRR